MRVEESRISKANVCPYRGSEIPNWEALRLDPNRIYNLLRDPVELEKAAASFSGKPLLIKHVGVSAELPQQDLWVGTVGTVTWEPPYLVARPLMLLTKEAIDALESGGQRELSAAYRYDAEMTPGVYGGKAYDGRMVNIRGNHVALVHEGRVGPDVHVADELTPELKVMSRNAALFERLKKANLLASSATLIAFDAASQVGETPAETVVELSADEMKEACDAALEEKRKEHGEDAELDEEEKEEAYERARDKKRGKDAKKGKDSKRGKDSKHGKDGKEGVSQNHAGDGEVDHRKDFDPIKAKDELRTELKAELSAQFRDAAIARDAVKPLVGTVSLIAMDSAEQIYRFALDRVGHKRAKTAHVDALADMVAAAIEAKQIKPRETPIAMDSNNQPFDFEAIFKPRAAA
jgi:hypothetical protein